MDLLLPGDVFGFSASEEYDYTVEAVAEGTVVASYPRRRVEMLADADPLLGREIRQVAFAALARLQAQLLILGRITALEKVGSFILEIATRMSSERGNSVALPMSRYDIADYLAVSVETVSRSLTYLKQRGVIKFSGTGIVRIVDRGALEEGERPAHAAYGQRSRWDKRPECPSRHFLASLKFRRGHIPSQPGAKRLRIQCAGLIQRPT